MCQSSIDSTCRVDEVSVEDGVSDVLDLVESVLGDHDGPVKQNESDIARVIAKQQRGCKRRSHSPPLRLEIAILVAYQREGGGKDHYRAIELVPHIVIDTAVRGARRQWH